jgi:hypothetical protein
MRDMLLGNSWRICARKLGFMWIEPSSSMAASCEKRAREKKKTRVGQ